MCECYNAADRSCYNRATIVAGIVVQSFLYIAWYFVFSVLGNFNYFFYAAHLLDVAVCFKTLGTILQSVTHNGKQASRQLSGCNSDRER